MESVYREKLDELLSTARKISDYTDSDAFQPNNYIIKKFDRRDFSGLAEYDSKSDKILINKDVFDSFGGKLTIYENGGKEKSYGVTIENLRKLTFDDVVNDDFLINQVIMHEEAHRQRSKIKQVDDVYAVPKRKHDKLWLYFMLSFNAKLPDTTFEVEPRGRRAGEHAWGGYADYNTAIMKTAEELKGETNEAKEYEYYDVVILNEKTATSARGREFVKNVKIAYKDNDLRDIPLLLVDERGGLRVLVNNKEYRARVKLSRDGKDAKVEYNLV